MLSFPKKQSFCLALLFILLHQQQLCQCAKRKRDPRHGLIESVDTGTFSHLFNRSKTYQNLKPKAKQYYKMRHESASLNSDFVSVKNLNEYLHPFSKCFIHITNFQNVEIYPTTFPVVIRHHIPALLRIYGGLYGDGDVFKWIPRGLNATGENIRRYNCSFSNFHKNDDGLCMNLDSHLYFVKTRPWTCEITVALFPPLYIFSEIFERTPRHLNTYFVYPRIWSRFSEISIIDDGVAVETNVFNMWIVDDLHENKWEIDHIYKWKTTMSSRSIIKYLSHDTYFILETRRHGDSAAIVAIKVPYLCKLIEPDTRAKWPCKTLPKAYEISLNVWQEANLLKIHEKLSFIWQNSWHIYYVNGGDSISVERDFFKHFSMCSNYIEHQGHWIDLPFESLHDKFVHALSHVWQSIMGNYTYIRNVASSFINGICSNGKWIPEKIQQLNPFYSELRLNSELTIKDNSFVFMIHDHLNSLRFVSCGRPKNTGLAFPELVKIFDTWIWLWLVLSLMSISLLIDISEINQGVHFYTYLKKCSGRIFSLVKSLLEQGDDNLCTFSCQSSYYIGGAFMAAALVLSNAYKGQNVFNLVEQLKPIPYHQFEQLVQDNFSIYVGGFNPRILMQTLILKNFTGAIQSKHEVGLPIYADRNTGEFGQMSLAGGFVYSELKSIFTDMYGQRKKRNFSLPIHKTIQYLMNHSEILPNTATTMKRVTEEIFPPTLNFRMIEKRKQEVKRVYKHMVTKSFTRLQQDGELEIIGRCNRTALIVPDYVGHSLALKLTKTFARKMEVYIGKDILYERAIIVKLQGSVQLSMTKRVKNMASSGIWEFWMQIFRQGAIYREDGNGYEPKKPSMSGNIFILYVLLFCGLISSVVVWLIETRTCIYVLARDMIFTVIRVLFSGNRKIARVLEFY
ncbi:unnamed protein product [Orchesella dallaii]|uniref:Uncharacterized protein n=1 Tax=Orchesella dallaii TaxID=48710 RepID=A0ABP1RLM6_9HEXA